MSKQANPRLIGGFVLGSVVLALLLLTLVSSLGTARNRQTFVVYFQSSVNNLNVGAPVKWKGVPVGQVSDIRIRWNQDDLSADVPVFVEINLNRLSMELDERDVLMREIRNGMRAQLQLESLISGLLFIELNYMPDAPEARFVQREQIYPEIPTAPSALSEIGEMATNIVAKIQSIDFERLSSQLTEVLEQTNTILEEFDAPAVSQSLRRAADSVSELAASSEVRVALAHLARTSENLARLTERLDTASEPLFADIQDLSQQASETLTSVSATSDRLRQVLSPDSELLYNLDVALTELSAAARAAREFAQFLERNPRALITGRRTETP